jgi:AbrB family looped-hinge helix DNA binding protein
MTTVRVSSKGRIVIPRALRAAFHIEAGSELAIFAEGDKIHLRQTEQRFPRTEVAAGLGLLARPGRKGPTAADIKQTVGTRPKQRKSHLNTHPLY